MLIIFIECGDGHCIQWQHRTEQAILDWKISPYLVERQTGWAETVGPANAVWWQAHEITSRFGQSHNPSGKTSGKYSSGFTSLTWIHTANTQTHTHTVVLTPSALACLFPHLYRHAQDTCISFWKCFENNPPKCWLQLAVNGKQSMPGAQVSHVSMFAPEKNNMAECSLLCFAVMRFLSPTCTPLHILKRTMRACTLLSSVWVFVWFQYHCWPADRLRINHADSACSVTQRTSAAPDKNKRQRDTKRLDFDYQSSPMLHWHLCVYECVGVYVFLDLYESVC